MNPPRLALALLFGVGTRDVVTLLGVTLVIAAARGATGGLTPTRAVCLLALQHAPYEI
jgi:hypothetical protein